MHDPQFYKGFTAEQFAEDNRFQQWVWKMDQEQDQFWMAWLDANPSQLSVLLEARQLVEQQSDNNYGVRSLSHAEKEGIKAHIFQQLNLLGLEARKHQQTPVRKLTGRMLAAASVLLILASTWLLIKERRATSLRHSTLLAERTGPNQMKKILLPDSSIVILNANSALRYSADLSLTGSREVQLEGNAYFNVKKDVAYKSFVVHAHSLSITVLGTELNVNARSAAAEVGLISGKVKVTNDKQTQQPQQPCYLLPGDKIRLDTLQNTLIRSGIDPQLYSAWTDGKWNFRHTTLEEIAGLIKEYYGVDVRFTKEKNRHLSINAVIAVGSLPKLIPVLAQTLHIPMFLSDSRLIIE